MLLLLLLQAGENESGQVCAQLARDFARRAAPKRKRERERGAQFWRARQSNGLMIISFRLAANSTGAPNSA